MSYNPKQRLDASESVFFSRELEAIDRRIYDVKFPLLKGRLLVPKVSDVGEYDREYTYRQFETFGEAKILANGADDLAKVNVTGTEFTSRIKAIGASYDYDLFEIRAAAAKGKPLNDLKARAARRAIEEKLDSLLAFGSVPDGMQGFVNHTAVDASTYAPITKTTADDWAAANGGDGATGLEMVTDVNNLLNQVWTGLKEAQGITDRLVIAMPATNYSQLASRPMGDNADKTALRFLLDNSPFLEDIIPWHKLEGAGDGAAQRMICYARDPMVLGALIPQEYTPHPAQQRGLLFEIPTTAACGGTVIRYPVAMAYGDGI